MHIIPLKQGIFSVGMDKQFKKTNTESTDFSRNMTLSIQPFIIQLRGKNILLDAGLSIASIHSNKADIISLMESHNLQSTQIDMILLSHLHQDHFSGLFHPVSNIYLFPDAEIFIYKDDLENCISSNRYPLYTDELKRIKTLSNTKLLEEKGGGKINDYIRYSHTGAHMPYHIVFWIEDEGETIFFGGDEAPQLTQMKMNVVAKYDYDGKKANQLRKEWFQKGTERQWQFLFYHDVKHPIVKGGIL